VTFRPEPLPLWAGRSLAFVGIMMVAFNVRTAVAAISPIVGDIIRDVPLDSIQLGIIGTIPPVAFSFAALFGAAIARRVGIERLLVIAIVTMIVGHLLRAAGSSFVPLLGGTLLALVGAGIGNVLLPPLVKRYFPDRIGLVTAIYVSMVSVSAAVPSVLAAPVTDAAGWRVSLGIWAIVALVCLLPWVAMLVRHRRETVRAAADPDMVAAPAEVRLPSGIWRSKVAWALALTFALSSGHAYTAFAWLPQMLVDIAGVSGPEAGVMLGAYSLMGVPAALIVPVLAVRMRHVGQLVYVGIFCFVAGYAGMLLAPAAAPWLWVLLAGFGPLLFPVVLTLVNLRSRTQQGSVALSGFAQGIGYAVGALGPLTVAILHDISGGWTLPLWYLIGSALVTLVAGYALRRHVFIEDELNGVAPKP